MKKEGALFDLIKSLTKSEKRFIKIFASRYTIKDNNNYVKLFDSLDKLKVYDEAKLRKKIKSASFSGNFRGVKNYLYFLILDCLDFYHKDSSVDRKISKYINIARVLSEKRLDEQSDKVVERVRKLSGKFNRFENIIALNSLNKATAFKKETISKERLQLSYKENLSALENMRLKVEYNKIYDELLHKRLKIGLITSQIEKRKLKVFTRNPYFNEPTKNNSFDVQMFYLLAKIEYYRILMDIKNGGAYVKKLIDLFESNTDRITDNTNHYLYVYALNVFFSEQAYVKNRTQADIALKKIVAIPSLTGEKNISPDVRVQIFQIYNVLATHVALMFRDYESALLCIKKFEIERKRFEKFLTPSFLLCMQSNVACIYFGLGRYKEALKWCNEAMTHPPKTRDDVIYRVRVVYLLVHYDLGNQIILPSLISSAENYLKKIKHSSQFVPLFLKQLRLLLRADSKKDKVLVFSQFRNSILPLLNNKFENDIFDDIDIIGWIDMKIKNLSF